MESSRLQGVRLAGSGRGINRAGGSRWRGALAIKAGSAIFAPVKAKNASSPSRPQGLTLGLEGFAWISAVEGIKLSQESLEMFAEFERRGLSGEEQDRAILAKHKKKA